MGSRRTRHGQPESEGAYRSQNDSFASSTGTDYLIRELLADEDDRHLSYEQMAAYVGRTLPTDEWQTVLEHVAECHSCSTDVANLLRIAEDVAARPSDNSAYGQLEVDTAPAAVPIHHRSTYDRPAHMTDPVLSDTALLVLEAVARGYRFGFDIMDVTHLPSGTVYPALRRLESFGLVRSDWETTSRARTQNRRRRRNYELTAAGRGMLAVAESRYRAVQQLFPQKEPS